MLLQKISAYSRSPIKMGKRKPAPPILNQSLRRPRLHSRSGIREAVDLLDDLQDFVVGIIAVSRTVVP
jgi:hypothetical protein